MKLNAYYLPLIVWGLALGYMDGDTIDVCSPAGPCVRVRLLDVLAPERHTPAGKKAKLWLQVAVDGRFVRCQTYRKDKYGNLLGTCQVGDVDLAELTADTPGVVYKRKGGQ